MKKLKELIKENWKWVLFWGIIWLAISTAVFALTIYIFRQYPKAIFWVLVFHSLCSGIIATAAVGILRDRIIKGL